MKKVLKWLDVNFEPLLIAVLFTALILLITIQVILRLSPLAMQHEITDTFVYPFL